MEEALKFLKDSVARFGSMENPKVAFELSLERTTVGIKLLKGDDSIDQGQIGRDESIRKTNEHPLKMCLDGHISSDKGSDRFRVCVDVGEKLLECVKAAISDVDQFSVNGNIISVK